MNSTAIYNSSDYTTSQQVKKSTLELVSVLRSIIIKGTYSRGVGGEFDLSPEKAKINDFLNSSTAFAFHIWCGKKSKDSQDKPEDWRTFFLDLASLIIIEDPYSAALKAIKVEKRIQGLTENDLKTIASYLENIPNGLALLQKFREHDVIMKVMDNIVEEERVDPNNFKETLLYLKNELKINDPNIDLWLGVFDDDINLVESALEDGADPNITDKELLSKYKEQLKNR